MNTISKNIIYTFLYINILWNYLIEEVYGIRLFYEFSNFKIFTIKLCKIYIYKNLISICSFKIILNILLKILLMKPMTVLYCFNLVV